MYIITCALATVFFIIAYYAYKEAFMASGATLTCMGAIILFLAGTGLPLQNSSYLIISKITQVKYEYIVNTGGINIHLKQCPYKVGDTLWIKK